MDEFFNNIPVPALILMFCGVLALAFFGIFLLKSFLNWLSDIILTVEYFKKHCNDFVFKDDLYYKKSTKSGRK